MDGSQAEDIPGTVSILLKHKVYICLYIDFNIKKLIFSAIADAQAKPPQTPTKASSRFAVQAVSDEAQIQTEIRHAAKQTEPKINDDVNTAVKLAVDDIDDDADDDEYDDLGTEVSFRKRAGSSVSQLTQSDLSRLGMLTAISDAGMYLLHDQGVKAQACDLQNAN